MSSLIVPGFTVRPISVEDADAWAAYACLPEVKLHTSSMASSIEDVEREITKTLANDAAAPIRFVLQQGDRLAAPVGFHTISPLNRTAEITYDVAPDTGVTVGSTSGHSIRPLFARLRTPGRT